MSLQIQENTSCKYTPKLIIAFAALPRGSSQKSGKPARSFPGLIKILSQRGKTGCCREYDAKKEFGIQKLRNTVYQYIELGKRKLYTLCKCKV